MKKTIKDYNYNDKTVIIRCDLNVPIENGKITDDTRIKESLISINYLLEQNAKVIILSHLGKIKSEEDKIKNTLKPVYEKLKTFLNYPVYFSSETRGTELENKIKNLTNKKAWESSLLFVLLSEALALPFSFKRITYEAHAGYIYPIAPVRTLQHAQAQ